MILQHDLPIPEDEKDTLQFRQIVDKAAHSGSVQVKLVADLSRRDPFYSVMPETTLLNVMDVFSKGIHRVAVIDADGTLKGVISQSAVVKFLRENMERFPEIIPKLSKTIKELKMESSPEIHVLASDTSVLKALRATGTFHGNSSTDYKINSRNFAVEHGLSSLPIVDHSGSLLASFSLSDLRYIMTTHKLNLLRRTCFDFAKYVDNQIGITTGRDRFPVFDVSPSSTLVKAVDKVVATKAHRVWVCFKFFCPWFNHSRVVNYSIFM